MENTVLTAMKERRSIRKYKKEQISDEQLHAILEAATYAPTGMGMQSPVMVVVQRPELIQKLSRLNAQVMGSENDPFYGSSVHARNRKRSSNAASCAFPRKTVIRPSAANCSSSSQSTGAATVIFG